MTIVLRLLHIICGVLWVGGVGVLVMFIMPAISATGPIGGQFMQHVAKNTKISVFFPMLGVLTVLSGLGLFWHNQSVSSGTFASSRPGMAYSLGAASAILALIIGGIAAGRGTG